MARARNIKPGFFSNEQLAECEPLARLLFAGLWCWADREGRLEDRALRLKAQILPYDDCDMSSLLTQLESRQFIKRYTVKGCKYIQINKFLSHQNPHVKEAKSTIPAPCKNRTSRADSLILDSLNPHPDSLNPIGGDAAETSKGHERDSPALPTETPAPANSRYRPEDVPIPEMLNTPDFIAARDEWFTQRRARRLSLRAEYLTKQYERLLPLGPTDAAACLRLSADNDYDGLFPERFTNARKRNGAGPGQVHAADRHKPVGTL